jgi:hypothetical protein
VLTQLGLFFIKRTKYSETTFVCSTTADIGAGAAWFTALAARRVTGSGAVCVGFDQLPDSRDGLQPHLGDGDMVAHPVVSLFDSFTHGKSGHSRMARGSRNLDPVPAEFAGDAWSTVSC